MSADYPPQLAALLEDFSFITSRDERLAFLLELAERFPTVQVTAEIARPPYDETHHVQYCESDAYVWALERGDGTLDFRFDVLNPQGVSAKAMCVILGETLSGADLAQVAAVPANIVHEIFGREIAMGKGQGLMGIVQLVAHEAKRRLG